MIKRGKHFIEVAYFLSRFGVSDPPSKLNTDSWRLAYHMFFERLNEGRDINSFEHSLKNCRDAFDSHFPSTMREGWKDKNGNAIRLSGLSLNVFNSFQGQSENQIWDRISSFCNLDATKFEQEFEIVSAMEESEKSEITVRTEGGSKVYISQKVERNPKLRDDALKIHGYDCAVCKFNFEKTYGTWGKNWAEVHHLKPVSENKDTKRITDPRQDLIVLCANCHRMIHRKKGIALTIDELKKKLLINIHSGH
uniref:HNH endonuclease n=1 Tax=Algoriphagus sp. TaxID=1872435 RepID=UPI0040479F78